ncbi:branched-chain amino acid aminotransferase [Salsuginibacillus kocurii]|uniref:branched-chain amino acid aminotransferase n=1 Tax=Salsuginibacillus kocurii TaxID=427078 RepID=UPI000362A809|nr:branched-chain amino acid aminotransferase [Salsuginibacillus kocurii]
MEVRIDQVEERKEKPDYNALQFGKHFTDHMFVIEYTHGKGWHDPRITPYAPLTMDPASLVFHYGQAVFEGLKAYYADGEIVLFRPEQNFRRLNQSNERMTIPPVDEDFMVDALKQLVHVDREWVPTKEGQSLYIRPFVIATEAALSVKPSAHYTLMIIMSPVGAYYASGEQMQPVSIYVEDEYVRSVKGGVGFTKTSGNYAASLKAQSKAEALGYDQVLWLDAVENRYVEEVGSMNIFFKIGGKVLTPALNGSILEGITRKSVIELLHHWGYEVVEAHITMEDIYDASQSGKLEEVFGTGTAAVISPVGTLKWKEEEIAVNGQQAGELSKRLYEAITGIQTGDKQDEFNWTETISMK